MYTIIIIAEHISVRHWIVAQDVSKVLYVCICVTLLECNYVHIGKDLLVYSYLTVKIVNAFGVSAL